MALHENTCDALVTKNYFKLYNIKMKIISQVLDEIKAIVSGCRIFISEADETNFHVNIGRACLQMCLQTSKLGFVIKKIVGSLMQTELKYRHVLKIKNKGIIVNCSTDFLKMIIGLIETTKTDILKIQCTIHETTYQSKYNNKMLNEAVMHLTHVMKLCDKLSADANKYLK